MQRRILFLLTDLEIGGTPTVVRELAIRLNQATNAHIEVAGLSAAGPLLDQLLARQISCTALGARSPRDLFQTIPRLRHLVMSRRIDTLVSFLLHANALAALMRPLHPRLRCFQSIQTTQPYPSWHWSLQRWIHHAADQIIVPSKSVADIAARRAGIPASRITVISNAIDPTDFAPPAARGTAGAPDSTVESRAGFNIGFIGRLDPIKRIQDLIHAMALLPAIAHLHIYGEGPERPHIEAEIARLALRGRVTLHGVVARPHDALHAMDLLVLPSDAEGFGLVLIEAMAAGVPIVATNVPGIRDVVIHDQNGLLAPPRSPKELSQAIGRLIGDRALGARLVQGGRATVQSRYTWQRVLPEYIKLLEIA